MRIKYYFRYCDDFVILNENKESLEKIILKIKDFVSRELKLELHPNKISIRKFRQGIDFLGYVVLPHASVIRTKTKNRILRKMDSALDFLNQGLVDKNSFQGMFESYLGVLSHCRNRKIRQKIIKIKNSLTK